MYIKQNFMNMSLLELIENGEVSLVKDALAKAGEDSASFQDESSGESLLMRASGHGNLEMVKMLLENGAPWNAIDKHGKCAGEYALDKGHQEIVDCLVNWGVQAEMILGAIETRKLEGTPARNEEYLNKNVTYTDDKEKLMDTEGEAVMMEWERPLMEVHAQVLCTDCGQENVASSREILNVGFGMGIIDTCIQQYQPKSHTIIEAHPQVYEKMIKDGWDKRPGVKVVFGRWQDVIDQLGPFDGIFFDTYGEYYSDMKTFHQHLPKLLKPNGIYSFFNGLCPRNIFFHGVCCQVVQLELGHLGLETIFHPCEVKEDVHADKTWDGVTRRYWWNDTYYLPIARKTTSQ